MSWDSNRHGLSSRVARAVSRCGAGWVRGAALAATLVSGFILGGCSEPDHGSWSLLARQPDRVNEQKGVLEVDGSAQWGEHGVHGWTESSPMWGDDFHFVWSIVTQARLILTAGPKEDRTVKITMWCPPGSEPDEDGSFGQPAIVSLNNVQLGEVQLGAEPVEYEFSAHEPLWHEGDNVLEVAIQEMRPTVEDPSTRVGVAISRVEYGEVRLPTVTSTSSVLELDADTGVTYGLESASALELDILAQASGPGQLQIEIAHVDRATGDILGSGASESVTVTHAEGGEIDQSISIPSTDEGRVQVELSWRGQPGNVLHFAKLDAVHKAPVQKFPIILLSIDTLAAKHMSIYGYHRDTTPELAEFAKDAVVFEHCVTNAPWTLPSFLSLMSGMFARSHKLETKRVQGVVPNLWEKWSLAENRWTLAEALRAGGWGTGGFVDSNWLTERYGLEQGFDHYDSSASDYARFPGHDPEGGIVQVSRMAMQWIDLGREVAVTDEEMADLEARGGNGAGASEEFFAFLHCFDVHGPYGAAEPHDGCFHGDEYFEQGDERWAGGPSNQYGTIPAYIVGREFPDESTVPERMWTGPIVSLYDEGIIQTDQAVGRLFDQLKERGIYDDALIIVTADHGETMDESDFLFGHGVLDERCLHIPLIVKMPGNANAGRRVEQSVQIVDIYPTIADLAGLPAQSQLHGRSLAPLLDGEDAAPAPTLTEAGVMSQMGVVMDGWKYVFKDASSECAPKTLLTLPNTDKEWVAEHFPEVVDRPMTEALLAEIGKRPDYRQLIKELRLQHTDPIIELYDLRVDPEAQNNLFREHPDKVEEFERIRRELIAVRDLANSQAVLRATPPQLGAEEVEMLRKLGYATDDPPPPTEEASEN